MNETEYLNRYGRDKNRLTEWVVANGGNPAYVKDAIKKFADMNHGFHNGTDFDKAILQEVHNNTTANKYEFHQMSFWRKIKWLLMRKP